jgi:hypothetical protein
LYKLLGESVKSLTIRIFMGVACLAVGVSDQTRAGDTTATVLQQKFDRLYFSVGEEANVLAGSPFVIYNRSDSIFTGTIHASYLGLSISDITGGFFDSVALEGCKAVIATAEPDSHAVIRVATDIPLDTALIRSLLLPAGIDSAGFSLHWQDPAIVCIRDTLPMLDSLVIEYVADTLDLTYRLARGQLDGYLSYRRIEPAGDRWVVHSGRVPYTAVLIANPAREVNRTGVLTTSLYYRFDHGRLPLYFHGDRIRPVYSFMDTDSSQQRLYPFDPAGGRRLFSQLSDRPRRLAIWVERPELQPLADYFSDILSRERCRTLQVNDLTQADFGLAYVPVAGEHPCTAAETILELLAAIARPGTSAEEAIRTAQTQLSWVAAETDSTRRAYYIRQVERRLIDDLGVFPLFQPTAFFGVRDGIKGIWNKADGTLDVTHIRRVSLFRRVGRDE